MSCPTCDHTMQRLPGADAHYWCPRCGTVRSHNPAAHDEYVPALVGRCREFGKICWVVGMPGSTAEGLIGAVAREWKSLGIAESVNKPEDRPQ